MAVGHPTRSQAAPGCYAGARALVQRAGQPRHVASVAAHAHGWAPHSGLQPLVSAACALVLVARAGDGPAILAIAALAATT
eukprot:12469202-Alexandrium_andersonii.AAC.1